MNQMNRRDFMRRTAGALAVTTLTRPVTNLAAETSKLSATTMRTLGKTDIQ